MLCFTYFYVFQILTIYIRIICSYCTVSPGEYLTVCRVTLGHVFLLLYKSFPFNTTTHRTDILILVSCFTLQ